MNITKTTLLRYLIGTVVCAFSAQTISAEGTKLPYWKDIQTVAVNKEAPRTAFMSYDNSGQALTGKYENSPYYKLLNGKWNFYYVDAYKDLPANIEQPGADITWKEINVPGNWEVQGYGTAIYTNQPYDFQPSNPQPPHLPEANPVGVYQRDIEIPSNWDGRDIYLRLEGAKSGVYVYLNGKEVGYSEDSKNPAEFLINKYLQPGKNSLVVKCFRYSTGSYLECQDRWRLSGIEREVYLYSTPHRYIADYKVTSSLEKTNYKDGLFGLDVTIEGASQNASSIAYTLKDAEGAMGNRTKAKIVKNKLAPPFKQAEFDIVFGEGISQEGCIMDMGIQFDIIGKSGAWFSYNGEKVANGREKMRQFLKDNPEISNEIQQKIRAAAKGAADVVEGGADEE